jgi:hypothetical protein
VHASAEEDEEEDREEEREEEMSERLQKVYAILKEQQERWCAEEIDDPEEMWVEIPQVLDEVIPLLEAELAENTS